MKRKKGFTLVEIIVVVSIFVLLWSTVVFYFNDFLKSKVIRVDLEKFQNFLNEQEEKVKKQDIYDCQFFFHTGTYFSYSCDNYDSKEVFFSWMNYIDDNFDIETNVSPPESWEIDVFWDNKLQSQTGILTTDTFSFSWREFKDYRFDSSFSWEQVNTLWVSYWSEDNLWKTAEKYLQLDAIWTKEDKSGQSLTGVIFSYNQAGKEIRSWWKKYDEVFLFFNKWGYEESFKINTQE